MQAAPVTRCMAAPAQLRLQQRGQDGRQSSAHTVSRHARCICVTSFQICQTNTRLQSAMQEAVAAALCPGSPGVLHDPVVSAVRAVLARVSAVAHEQDTVVQLRAAGGIKDASSIQLELPLVSLNGHTDWLIGHSLQGQRWNSESRSSVKEP